MLSHPVLRRLSASFLLLGCAVGTFAQELPFTHFTPENNPEVLTSASVQVIHQDNLGYIWIGFYSSGLGRYDGSAIESYSTADGLPDPTVREVVEDRSGRLWVGCDTGLVVSERPLSFYEIGERIRFVNRVGDTRIVQKRTRRSNLVSDANGRLWAGTTGDGLFGYRFDDSGNLDVIRMSTASSPGSPEQMVNGLHSRDDGTFLAALNNGEILVFDSTTNGLRLKEVLRPGDQLPALTTMSLHETSNHVLWGGAASGTIWRMKPGEQRAEIVNEELSSLVVSMIEGSNGKLWVGSLGSGVVRMDPDDPSEAVHITRVNGLLGETLWKIALDHEGNLWFGQNGGLSRLRKNYQAFTNYTKISLPDAGAFSVLPDPASNRLWVGTGGGLSVIRNESEVQTITIDDGLADNSVYAIDLDRSGRIWLGTVGGASVLARPGTPIPEGSIRVRDLNLFGEKVKIASFDFTVVYNVRSLDLRASNDSDRMVETIWLGGNSGVSVFVDRRRVDFASASGLPGTGATALEIDDHGFLWVGSSDSGLFRSREPVTASMLQTILDGRERVTASKSFFEPVWNQSTGAPTNGIRNMRLIDDRLWIGTSAGLAIAESRPFRIESILNASNGLGGDVVVGTAFCPQERNLWVSQNEGLVAVHVETREVVKQVDKQRGLLENEGWAYGPVGTVPGVVYFANPKGLAIYRPALDQINEKPPILRLRRADYREALDGANEISLQYAALSFASEKGVRFRTRLVGYDADWSVESNQTRIRYTNLPAYLFRRSYTFEVIARNSDGVWTSEPLSYTFSVLPPWWLRWWAAVFYFAAFLATIAGANRYRTRNLARRNRELERLIDARTSEIRSQAMEIETIDRIVQVINREVEFERVLQALLEQGMILFPQAEKGAAILFNHEKKTTTVAAVVGYEPEFLSQINFTVEEALSRYSRGGERIQEGVYLVRDFAGRAGSEKTMHLPIPRSMLAMDVTLGGRLEAFLVFDNFSETDAFQSSDVRKLRRYREHAVTAVAKAKILRELEIKNREAQQANEAKSRFLANMSHELRTPLNSIIGFSELLSERLDKEIQPRYLHFLRLILSSGQHLLTIINDILDLSKVEAGKMEVYPELFSLRTAIENVRQIMRGVASKGGVSIELDIPDELPPIETDPSKVKQILYNLVSNAVKFSPRDSSVTVVARKKRDESATDMFEIAVIDQGIGIAPENLEVIFDEFRQVDGSATRKFEGTGLGLALVKRYTEFLGGTIKAESEVGRGSTFTVRLPARYAPAEPVRQVPKETNLLRPEPKILVVEDDNSAYSVLQRQIESAGCQAIRARHGEEALRLARLIRPAAITLDIILPGMDGWETLKHLKEKEETRTIPVVIVSVTESQELGFALGADDYFVKPVEGALLVRRLAELIHLDEGFRPRLLLIDDDPSIDDLLRDTLAEAGFDVTYVSSGSEGVEIARATRPDLIILDLLMPRMSGFEAADELQRHDETRKIPIIVLTAKELTDDDRQNLESKIASIVTKGDAMRERLVEAISRLVGESDPDAGP